VEFAGAKAKKDKTGGEILMRAAFYLLLAAVRLQPRKFPSISL
jgi:hypothetical protein